MNCPGAAGACTWLAHGCCLRTQAEEDNIAMGMCIDGREGSEGIGGKGEKGENRDSPMLEAPGTQLIFLFMKVRRSPYRTRSSASYM